MKQTNRRVRTQFAPEVRFEVDATAVRAEQTGELEQLKNRLIQQLLEETAETEQDAVQNAANDAAALAWDTQFPLLLFPALLEEKVQTALFQLQRQTQVRQRSRYLVLEAA